MTPIKLLHINVVRALELKDELEEAGLVRDRDFEWEYHQAQYDNDSYTPAIPRHVIFKIQDPRLETFYRLKWAQ